MFLDQSGEQGRSVSSSSLPTSRAHRWSTRLPAALPTGRTASPCGVRKTRLARRSLGSGRRSTYSERSSSSIDCLRTPASDASSLTWMPSGGTNGNTLACGRLMSANPAARSAASTSLDHCWPSLGVAAAGRATVAAAAPDSSRQAAVEARFERYRLDRGITDARAAPQSGLSTRCATSTRSMPGTVLAARSPTLKRPSLHRTSRFATCPEGRKSHPWRSDFDGESQSCSHFPRRNAPG
jgi:hypothetical protein